MTDLERRLEELFMDDSRSRKVQRVDVAGRRRSPLFIAFVAAGAAVLAIVAGLTLGSLRDARQEVAQPSASPSAEGSTPSGSPPSATASPSGAPSGTREYRSPLGYTVQLPDGWRRSDLQSRLTAPPPGQGDPASLAVEVFTSLAPDDEQRAIASHGNATGLGAAQVYTAYVSKDANSRGLGHYAFAQSERGIYGFQAVSTEEISWYGRPAAKTVWHSSSGDAGTFYAVYLRDQNGHIWRIGHYLGYPGQKPPPGASQDDLRAIVESFLSVSANPIPPPPGGAIEEDFGIIALVSSQRDGDRAVFLRGERNGRAFRHLGAIALTLLSRPDTRPAGAVSPDGRRFAFWTSADPRGPATELRLWDAASPTTVSTLVRADAGGQGSYGDGVVWSNDGQGLLLSYSSTAKQPGTPILPASGAIRTYDFATRDLALVAQESGGGLQPVAWDRTRGVVAYVAVSREGTNYTLLRRGSDGARTPIPGASHVTASPDAAWVIAQVTDPQPDRAGPPSYLRAWPLGSPDRAVEIRAQTRESLTHRGWRPGTHEALVAEHASVQAGFGTAIASLWDPSTGARTDLPGGPAQPASFRADGSAVYMATSASPSRYVLHDIASGRRTDLPQCECAVVLRADEAVFAGVRLR